MRSLASYARKTGSPDDLPFAAIKPSFHAAAGVTRERGNEFHVFALWKYCTSVPCAEAAVKIPGTVPMQQQKYAVNKN
jgi:hypothetical protein